jgi:hypothetical protein
MDMSSDLLKEATNAFRKDFSDIVDFDPPATSSNLPVLSSPERASKSTPDRSALCPCGSGQKFRWCHGL